MKKVISALALAILTTIVMKGTADGQSSNSEYTHSGGESAAIQTAQGQLGTAEVNARAKTDFARSYTNASKVKWNEYPDFYTAQYYANDIRTLVYYSKKGRWQASIKAYSEDKLDPDVRDIVRRNFYDCRINFVRELETVYSHGMPTYLVYLEDANRFLQVRVNDSAIDVYKELKKVTPDGNGQQKLSTLQ